MNKLSNPLSVDIATLNINSFESMEQATTFILADGKVRNEFAVAINAEKIVSALEHKNVMKVLKSASLRYADGITIVWAMNKKGANGVRIPGCDLWTCLMQRSVEYKTPVYIVGASPQVNDKVVTKLEDLGVNLIGSQNGYFKDEDKVFTEIARLKPKIVSVAMGSPRQELFIQKCRKLHPDAFYMGVGGTYDVFVGEVQRAPVWMQNMHLEWTYRLLKQPSRVFRQSNLFKFIWLFLRNKL